MRDIIKLSCEMQVLNFTTGETRTPRTHKPIIQKDIEKGISIEGLFHICNTTTSPYLQLSASEFGFTFAHWITETLAIPKTKYSRVDLLNFVEDISLQFF